MQLLLFYFFLPWCFVDRNTVELLLLDLKILPKIVRYLGFHLCSLIFSLYAIGIINWPFIIKLKHFSFPVIKK